MYIVVIKFHFKNAESTFFVGLSVIFFKINFSLSKGQVDHSLTWGHDYDLVDQV